MRSIGRLAGIAVVAALAACGSGTLFSEYEYEEDLYLDLDGSATVIVNSSIPALVALRGFDLDPDPAARADRRAIAERYTAPFARVERVSPPWRRDGRRFVQIRVEVDDIRRLGESAPFGWSRYEFGEEAGLYRYVQQVGAPAVSPVTGIDWAGDEIVAFRLHLPSPIEYHNTPSGRVERGNILVWEQPLAERLAGVPLTLEARIGTSSILSTTLTLFGLAFAAAVTVLAGAVWWAIRRGPAEPD